MGNNANCYGDYLGLTPTVEELIEDVGPFDSNNDGIVDECWCEKFAKMLHRLAMDPAIESVNDFVSTLGTHSHDGESFLNTLSDELGRKLNNEQNIASKLFKPDQKDDKADKDAYMHQLTSRNIAYVGFKDELLANGANNVRHFVVGLAWGRFGTRIAQLEDRAQRFFGTRTGSRANQERTAEIASDRAAAGAYREFGRELDRDLRFWENKDSNCLVPPTHG